MNDSADKATFFRLSEAEPLLPSAGVEMRAVFGAGASLSRVRLEPDAMVDLHSHPHEQIGIVTEGIEILIIDGVEHEVGVDEAYVIPGGIPHAGRGGPEGCTVLDIFVPTREEYRAAAAPELSSLGEDGK
jgi:quercetin dioxygenase-like cupin family protein